MGREGLSCLKRANPESVFESGRRLIDGVGLAGQVGAAVDAGEDWNEVCVFWKKASKRVRASREDIIRNVEGLFRREGCGVCKEVK